MSITTSISTTISEIKAKKFAENMLAKANNPSAKFPDQKTPSVCHCCLGTAFRMVYHYGRRYAKRCESAIWDTEKKKLVCNGNPDWQELELANHKDLANQIWKIVTYNRKKEYFLFWLQREYQTQSLSGLLIQQLDLILNLVKSQAAFNSLTSQVEQTENKVENKAA